jgi:hypothetical protein
LGLENQPKQQSPGILNTENALKTTLFDNASAAINRVSQLRIDSSPVFTTPRATGRLTLLILATLLLVGDAGVEAAPSHTKAR